MQFRFRSGAIVMIFLLVGLCQATAEKRNVLFIICDDLNCDIGAYGHPLVKTPNIDKLAERGVLFQNAHCQYPLCGPSRASFMTGLYPDQTLVHLNGVYIREQTPNVQTLSQMYREAGYYAMRIGKIYHYNVPKHIGTGGHDDPYSWNNTINPRGRDVTEEPLIKTLQERKFGGTLSWLAAEGSDEEQTDGIGATAAVEELKAYAKDETPFFLAVGLFRPHTPFVAPKKYFELYPLEDVVVPSEPAGYLETLPKDAQKSVRRKKDQVNLSEEVSREVIQAYYASISFVDAQVGRILDALEETGLMENTVVIFTSDHGYHMGEHGHWQKTTLFENATRVPLIMASPEISAKGGVAKSPVEMVDFYPTLAELCELEAPAYLSGVSLVPALLDPSVKVREYALTQYANGYSIRSERFRYTEWGEDGARGAELYDHRSDPAEMRNLASEAEHAETVKQLSEALRARVNEARIAPEGVKQVPRARREWIRTSETFAPR